MIDGLKIVRLHRRAHEDALRRTERLPFVPEGLQLQSGGQPAAHQLDFVQYPEAIVREQAELARPRRPRGRIAAVERAGQQHVLRSD